MKANVILRILSLVVALLWATGVATAADQIVAQIGDEALTISEFEFRATELSRTGYPHLQRMDIDAKRQLLDGIIAQELLVLEGYRQGVDEDPVIKGDLEGTFRRALMRALYDAEALKGDYTSTEDEVRSHFVDAEFDTEVLSRHIVCDSEEEARKVLSDLAAGRPFGALVAEYSRPSIRKRFGPEGWVGWFRIGSLYEELREPMKTLSPGEIYSDPVKTALGFHIFGLKARRPVPFEAAADFVREDLRVKKRGHDMEAYVDGLRDRYQIAVNETGLAMLANLDTSETSVSDQILVTWEGGNMSVGDYMAAVGAERAEHPASIDREALLKRIDNFAGQHVMMTEGQRLGLHELPEVRRKSGERRRELFTKWLYQAEMKRRVQPDTSAATVRRFYDENLDIYTRDDGQVTPFSVVEGSIRSSLMNQAETVAMDEFLAELRQRYDDRIRIDEEALNAAFPGGGS